MVHVVVYGQSMAEVNGKERATWSDGTCRGLPEAAREVRAIVDSQQTYGQGTSVVGFHNCAGGSGRCRFVLPSMESRRDCTGWLDALEDAVATGSVNQVDVGRVRIFVIGG